MTNDPVLHLLGLARKAGRLEVGEEPVGAACRARQARLVLLAGDAAPNTRRRCAHFGEAGGVLWLELPFSKGELGFILGRSSCAMMALTDAGFAAAVCDKLAARNPEKYGPAARQLRAKADQVLQRQKERRQHEKNLREGRRKPWNPPPVKNGERTAEKKSANTPRTNVKSGEAPKKASRSNRVAGKTARPPKPSPGGRRLTGKFRRDP